MADSFYKLFNGGAGSGRYPKDSKGNSVVTEAESSHAKVAKDVAGKPSLLKSFFGTPVGLNFDDKTRLDKIQKHEHSASNLRDTLRTVASSNNGYLPSSKRVTQKEVDLAAKQLPKPDTRKFSDGEKRVVKIQHGISKGKNVEFEFVTRWDFKKNPNGVFVGEWKAPLPVEHPNFNIKH